MDFTGLEVYGVAIVPLIIGLLAAFTHWGLPKRLAPAVSLVLGIAAGVLLLSPDDPAKGVILGVGIGLTAVGLHSGTKNTVGK